MLIGEPFATAGRERESAWVSCVGIGVRPTTGAKETAPYEFPCRLHGGGGNLVFAGALWFTGPAALVLDAPGVRDALDVVVAVLI